MTLQVGKQKWLVSLNSVYKIGFQSAIVVKLFIEKKISIRARGLKLPHLKRGLGVLLLDDLSKAVSFNALSFGEGLGEVGL